MTTIETIFCVDGSGNKNPKEANLKRPVYRLDVASGQITRPLLRDGETTYQFFERQIQCADVKKPLLIAADLPIGLPESWPEVFQRIDAKTFPEWLKVTSLRVSNNEEGWRDELIVKSVDLRSPLKPFVSFQNGGEAARVNELRHCDLVTGGECLYRVDQGGKQAGKAAMQFWSEVLQPLVMRYQDKIAIWPFETPSDAKIIIGECYPAECQRMVYGKVIAKRNPYEVARAITTVLNDPESCNGISQRTCVFSGSSEDEFDIFTTAFAFRKCLREGRELFWHPKEP